MEGEADMLGELEGTKEALDDLGDLDDFGVLATAVIDIDAAELLIILMRLFLFATIALPIPIATATTNSPVKAKRIIFLLLALLMQGGEEIPKKDVIFIVS